MKLKDGFVLKNIIDEWIVMPVGSNVKKFKNAIILNDVSVFMWKQLAKSVSYDELMQSVLDEYDIDKESAAGDLDKFLEQLRSLDILAE